MVTYDYRVATYRSKVIIDPKENFDGWLAAKLSEYNRYYAKRYPLIGTGRNRSVYRMSSSWVVKVPINDEGMMDNQRESGIYDHYGKNNEIAYAACEQFYLDKNDGIPLLRMEYVKPIKNFRYKDFPTWVMSIDLGQVGYDKDGKLVAFDYA